MKHCIKSVMGVLGSRFATLTPLDLCSYFAEWLNIIALFALLFLGYSVISQ